jgi:BirA family biotin operon repressor/biotin-[acetyl-CoA-carboxylase] ligase
MKSPHADLTILRAMLTAGGGFVSGTALAQELGMSRVAIWQHMEKLREQGFVFEAVRSRGYRLTDRPMSLHALSIKAQIALSTPCSIITLDTVDSTNDEAMRRVGQGHPTPLIVISREQTKGRGRMGRDWLSEPNGNLYITFALQPNVAPSRLATITPWIGVNLCHFIANYCRISPQIKWPNDLILNGRKAGGILTEARIDTDRIRDLVIGFGLNLARPKSGWPGELATRAIALDEVYASPIDVNHFAAALIGRVLKACAVFSAQQHTTEMLTLWSRFDSLHEREITLLHGTEAITGIAQGIDSDGSLLLRIGSGAPQRFLAGEVTLAKR